MTQVLSYLMRQKICCCKTLSRQQAGWTGRPFEKHAWKGMQAKQWKVSISGLQGKKVGKTVLAVRCAWAGLGSWPMLSWRHGWHEHIDYKQSVWGQAASLSKRNHERPKIRISRLRTWAADHKIQRNIVDLYSGLTISNNQISKL